VARTFDHYGTRVTALVWAAQTFDSLTTIAKFRFLAQEPHALAPQLRDPGIEVGDAQSKMVRQVTQRAHERASSRSMTIESITDFGMLPGIVRITASILGFSALVTLGCAKPSANEASVSIGSSDNLFVWDRPAAPIPKLPITNSATCSFKKGVAVSFHRFNTEPPTVPERIYYSLSDEDESDTVTFLDLDTNAPKVQSNGGQASLQVLYRSGQMLTLIHTAASPTNGDTEVYTIYLDKGVVILSQQQDAQQVGPLGSTLMGYCN
jgi:hypothetical protein